MKFDPNHWIDKVGPPETGAFGSVTAIIGPCDACELIQIRRLLRPLYDFGMGIPSDLFIMSIGESPDRACTSIGGLPYWRQSKKWPLSKQGSPLRFIAQFDFRESFDIVASLPGDLLLVFGDPASIEEAAIEWETVAAYDDLVSYENIPIKSQGISLFGTAWRTESYPQADFPNGLSIVELDDGTNIQNVYFASELLGMQIGRSPFILPPLETVVKSRERILCSMSSVFPRIGAKYPFLNHPAPLNDHDALMLSINLSSLSIEADGLAVLYVVDCGDGAFRLQLEEL
jgi:hypothetical protein